MTEQVLQGSHIPDKIYFTIGEVSEFTGLEAHVLRYWETEFPTLHPKKNNRGQRTYQKKDIEQIMLIKDLLYNKKFTIAGARKALKGSRHDEQSGDKKGEEMIIFLKRLHNELISLNKNLKGESSEDLFHAE